VLGSALDDNAVHVAAISARRRDRRAGQQRGLFGSRFAARHSRWLQAHASREQKTAAMAAFGTYQPVLREWEQVFGEDAAAALARQIAREKPENVVFRPKVFDPALSQDERRSA
jgi:hypothetical protein